WTSCSAPAPTCSAPGRCSSRWTGSTCCIAPRSHTDDSGPVLPGARREERVELLLQLPVPASRTASRDHCAVRVLPRGGRRRRRVQRSGARPHQARLVAHRDRHRVFRRTAAPGDPRSRAGGQAIRPAEQRFHEIIDGMAMDLSQNRYRDFDALRAYCHRVAGVVGLMAAQIFGYRDPATQRYAEELGIAFQLTNIVRDVGEDARRDRIYLPEEDLARFGVTASDLLQLRETDAMRRLLAFEIRRAREYDERAMARLPKVDRRSQRPGLVMAAIYRAVLDEIEASGCSVLNSRIGLTPIRKLW